MNNEASLSMMLKDLRLPTMLAEWESLAKKGIQDSWNYGQFLSALCNHELCQRDSKRLERRLKEAKLPLCKSIESFDFKAVPSLNKAQVMGLSDGDLWVQDAKNVLLFGPSGVGKTHLAAAIGERLVHSGYRVLFTRTTELLQKLQAAKRDYVLPAELAKLDKYDCLILDDFGYVKKSEMETSLLFELISERYESRSLLITCNQPFQEWDEIFADGRMAIAAVDRLVHHSVILQLSGKSYRMLSAESQNSNTVSEEVVNEKA